jgi:hypothetical protein
MYNCDRLWWMYCYAKVNTRWNILFVLLMANLKEIKRRKPHQCVGFTCIVHSFEMCRQQITIMSPQRLKTGNELLVRHNICRYAAGCQHFPKKILYKYMECSTVKPVNNTYPWDLRKSSAVCRDVPFRGTCHNCTDMVCPSIHEFYVVNVGSFFFQDPCITWSWGRLWYHSHLQS